MIKWIVKRRLKEFLDNTVIQVERDPNNQRKIFVRVWHKSQKAKEWEFERWHNLSRMKLSDIFGVIDK
jgi:DNA-binding MarR family transcriptional regulator